MAMAAATSMGAKMIPHASLSVTQQVSLFDPCSCSSTDFEIRTRTGKVSPKAPVFSSIRTGASISRHFSAISARIPSQRVEISLKEAHFSPKVAPFLPNRTRTSDLSGFPMIPARLRFRKGSGSSGVAVYAASTLPESTEVPSRPKRPGERKGFVEEMRLVAMKLHTKDQAKEGEKEADVQPVGGWKPSIQGYLRFLVDNKLIYSVLESIVDSATHPSYAEFRNTGLERVEALEKDLEWFKEQGHEIPEPSEEGKSYAEFLKKIAEEDPPAFICHFYNYYFAHTAGGRFIGKKVADEILEGKVLEFYKWKGELPKLLNGVRDKINKIAEEWSREDKDRCLKETEKSFTYSGKILRQIIS